MTRSVHVGFTTNNGLDAEWDRALFPAVTIFKPPLFSYENMNKLLRGSFYGQDYESATGSRFFRNLLKQRMR